MMLGLLFVCGATNFLLGKAMLESGHPVIDSLPPALRRGGGWVALVFEFLVLLAAMLLAASGWSSAGWLYGGYTLVNAAFYWMIAKGRL
jgi:hypothetical protein